MVIFPIFQIIDCENNSCNFAIRNSNNILYYEEFIQKSADGRSADIVRLHAKI